MELFPPWHKGAGVGQSVPAGGGEDAPSKGGDARVRHWLSAPILSPCRPRHQRYYEPLLLLTSVALSVAFSQ